MTWIVLTVLFSISFWVGVGIFAYGKSETKNNNNETPHDGVYAGFLIIAVSVFLWFGATAWSMVHTVGQREVAVVFNFSGTVAGRKDPGVITTMPWQHIKKENVGILHDEWSFSIDDNSAAVSKDQQRIGALLSINYRIDSQNVVDLYKRVGSSWKSIIIDARVPQVFKEVTATYATTDITANREKLRIDTKTRLTQELEPYDIDVVDVFVKNLGFSDSYTEAINAKQRQVQDALRAEAKVRQVEAEAAQAVAKAQGEAKANIARARGDATSNRLRQRSLTPALIQWEAIQKLNPNVQIIVCPPRTVCIPNSNFVPLDSEK